MFKRVTWFVAGAVAGASGSMYARRKARAAAARYRPVAVVRTAAGRVKGRAAVVAEAVRDGRSAMREREAELLAEFGERSGAPARPELRVVRIDRHGHVVERAELELDDVEPAEPEPPRRGRPGPRRRARR